MTRFRSLVVAALAGTMLAIVVPVSAASADDFDCYLQFEPPPECFDPPEDPPQDPPPPSWDTPTDPGPTPPPPEMMPVQDMRMMPNQGIPTVPIPGNPGEACGTFGVVSKAFTWEADWRIRTQYTFFLNGQACVDANGRITRPVVVSSRTIASPRDPRLKSVSDTRPSQRSGAGTSSFVAADELTAVFCDDPFIINSCNTYRHVVTIQITPNGARAKADLFITPGAPPGTI